MCCVSSNNFCTRDANVPHFLSKSGLSKYVNKITMTFLNVDKQSFVYIDSILKIKAGC